MDPKMMEKAFETAQKSHAGGLDLTPEETERFKKAFDDPEFCRLMADYVEDLQNPAYRAETESYISELEGENKVPQGKELIRPSPGFVAKAFKVTDGVKGDKVFINIVSSEKITKPTSVNTPQGTSWSLPYSVGPPHMESDKNGSNAAAFDVCFHPLALQKAHADKRFRDLLVRTGLDGVKQAYKLQKQDVSLSEDFHVLKGVSYKQGQVPSMLIDKATRVEKWKDSGTVDGRAAEDTKSANDTPPNTEEACVPTPAKNISANQPVKHSTTVKQGSREPVIKKGFLTASDKTRAAIYPEGSTEGATKKIPPPPLISELKEPYSTTKAKPRSPAALPVAAEVAEIKEKKTTRRVADPDEVSKTSEQTVQNKKTPVYCLKERGIISMGDFEGVNKAAGVVADSSNRPAELVYTIELPLVTKPSNVQLDVGERTLQLSYSDIYNLNIRFPYDVLDKKGTAKYDKSAKTLTVTVPVKPAERKRVLQAVDEIVEGVLELPAADGVTAGNSSPAKITTDETSINSLRNKNAHNRWVSREEVETSNGTGIGSHSNCCLADEIAAKAREALEKHQAEVAKPALAKVLSPSEAQKDAVKDEQIRMDSYIASKVFVGHKTGYCFKLGELGQGYYLDTPLHLRVKHASAPAPKAVASPSYTIDKFEPFPFEYRQTKDAVAILIQVPNIKGNSVTIDFFQNGLDLAFSALNSDGKMKLYSMKITTAAEVDETKCKYDVASLNMVVALPKRHPSFWREDKLVSPNDLSEFEKTAKKALSQPFTILRLWEGSVELQRACVAKSSTDGTDFSSPGSLQVSADSTPVSNSRKAPISSSTGGGTCTSSSVPATSGDKMKFTVGALLDLD